ncbi:histone deacetylase [Streptomyces sp. NPDC014734]|uniref:histone deacetylase n=1 Tax=Streptomyces sp. NPDC014734 TaxID=3364886 RepID=UPI0037010704
MPVLTRIDPVPPGDPHPRRIWYLSYGSNTHPDRLARYIGGGRTPGAVGDCPGCRDTRMPSRSLAVEPAGAVYFATESPVWGGGRAFYDPSAGGRALARAHLITAEQFSDIAAQEMYREPGPLLDLTEVLARGRAVVGEGRYETLVCAGQVDGLPVLTFTAPWGVDDVTPVPPSAAYLRCLASGLLSAGVWGTDTVAAHLASCPGAAGHWSPAAVAGLLREPRREGGGAAGDGVRSAEGDDPLPDRYRR